MSHIPDIPPENNPNQQNAENPYAPSTIQQPAAFPSSGPAGRGGLILGFGIASLLLTVFGFCCGILGIPVSIISIVLGGLAGFWGKADLKEMNEGVKDPSDRSQTQIGMIMGFIGAVIAMLSMIFFVIIFVLAFSASLVG